MQKLFLKTVFFLVGISLSLNLLGTLAQRAAPLEDWRVEFQERGANFKARNESIEAITLGNSHADSIDYSVLEMEGQSLALAAADLFELEKTVISLDDKSPNLKTVFITISYYSFSRDNSKFDALRSRRVGFYSMVPVWSPIKGDWTNFLMGKLDAYTHVMSVVRSDSWQAVWPALLLDASQTNPFPYDGVQTSSVWGECFHYTAEQLDTHAREIAGRNVSSSIQMANAHPGLEQDSFDALARTIKRLQARGVRVIIYTPPYYQKYNTYFADGGSHITDQMRLAVSKLQETYGVEYYDFSNDPELTTHPGLFYNSDHLNECGYKVFSAKLLEQLGGNGRFDK
ncbi:MAG: SGNH/GDSL hydrolase family protein [Chloroflexota bacterium]